MEPFVSEYIVCRQHGETLTFVQRVTVVHLADDAGPRLREVFEDLKLAPGRYRIVLAQKSYEAVIHPRTTWTQLG